MSNTKDIPDWVYTEEDVEGPFRAKIGTRTPQLIWIHIDDVPVEKGATIRFVKTDPSEKHEDWWSERQGGRVRKIVE
jgi:hypothetical protein